MPLGQANLSLAPGPAPNTSGTLNTSNTEEFNLSGIELAMESHTPQVHDAFDFLNHLSKGSDPSANTSKEAVGSAGTASTEHVPSTEYINSNSGPSAHHEATSTQTHKVEMSDPLTMNGPAALYLHNSGGVLSKEKTISDTTPSTSTNTSPEADPHGMATTHAKTTSDGKGQETGVDNASSVSRSPASQTNKADPAAFLKTLKHAPNEPSSSENVEDSSHRTSLGYSLNLDVHRDGTVEDAPSNAANTARLFRVIILSVPASIKAQLLQRHTSWSIPTAPPLLILLTASTLQQAIACRIQRINTGSWQVRCPWATLHRYQSLLMMACHQRLRLGLPIPLVSLSPRANMQLETLEQQQSRPTFNECLPTLNQKGSTRPLQQSFQGPRLNNSVCLQVKRCNAIRRRQ
jgi:hypothetical protein